MTSNAHRFDSTEGQPQSTAIASSPRKWLRLLLAGNPFFIASAALLLLGINRLAVDPNFLRLEESKLLFNFSALQLYEALLIGVAIFLSARSFLSDSILLVVIESIVLLVPFMLITQAAMIDHRLALVLCAIGSGLVVIRFTALKSWFSELNLPGRSLFLLAILALLNGGTPLLLRHAVDIGGSDQWETPYQWGWTAVIPAAVLLGLFARSPAAASAQTRPWMPLLLYSLWASGTAVHLWCMGYVTNREFHLYLLTPAIWAASWVAYAHADLFVRATATFLKPALTIVPVAVILLAAAATDSRMFFGLAVLNSVLFAILSKRRPEARWLLVVSLAMAVASWPLAWTPGWFPALDRAKCLELGIGGLIVALAARAPSVASAVCGAFVAGLYPQILWPNLTGHLSLQVGLVFLLLKSLRWEGSGLGKLRIVTAATWIVHAFGWTYAGGTISGWTVSSAAVIILLAYPIFLYLTGAQKSRLIPTAAWTVLSSWPLTAFARWIESASPGLVALLLSFALLGAGIWFAFYRKHFISKAGLASQAGL